MIYTFSEKTVKKYTVQDAINAADAIVKAKNIRGLCMNAVNRLDRDEKITLVRLNEISEQMIDDSIYYA